MVVAIPAVNSANSIVVDTNVIMNLLRSDPTGSSLNLLVLDANTTYITDTVESELRNNLSGQEFAVYLTWAYSNHTVGEVLLVSTGIPTGPNQGEASMLWAVENGFAGDGPYLVLTGDADARLQFGNYTTANSMEYANSLLLSGEITLARYYVLAAQLGVVAPHEVFGPNGANFAFVPGFRGLVNNTEIFVGANGITVNGEFVGLLQTFEIDPRTGVVTIDGPDNCFAAGTPVAMWDGSEKAIEAVVPGDLVLSYDAAGQLVPGLVRATRSVVAPVVLDFFGLRVTPGHLVFCAEGPCRGRHVPLLDILRTDGAVMLADGLVIRAATGAVVGSRADAQVWVARVRDGGVEAAREVRLGTWLQAPDGTWETLAARLAREGCEVTATGLVRWPGQVPEPYSWRDDDPLPRPEDAVLCWSGVTLAEVLPVARAEEARGPVAAATRSYRRPQRIA
jgi:hypothetical protein